MRWIVCRLQRLLSLYTAIGSCTSRWETALQRGLLMAKSRRLFYGHYRCIFNHCDVIVQQSNWIRWKKNKIRATTLLKVIQGHRGRYQSKVRMRLPISDLSDILYRTVSELSQLIVQILDTLRFWAPLGSLGTTYDVHLGLIGKCVVDFLLMLIELFASCFGWVATSEEIENRLFRSNVVSLIQNFR